MNEIDRRRLEQIRSLFEELVGVMEAKNRDLLPSDEKKYFENSIDYIKNYEYFRVVQQLSKQTLPIANIYGMIRPYRGLAEIASYLAETDPEITGLVERIEALDREGTLSLPKD